MTDPRAIAFPDVLESQVRAGNITCGEALEQLRDVGADPLDYATRMLMAQVQPPEHEALADALVYSVDPTIRDREARAGIETVVKHARDLRTFLDGAGQPEFSKAIGVIMAAACDPRG